MHESPASRELSSSLAMFAYVGRAVAGLNDVQLLKIPSGLRNNILWNIGHLVVDNCDMLYRPAGLEPPHPPGFTPLFAAGTSPADWKKQPSTSLVTGVYDALAEQLRKDYTSGQFHRFDPKAVVSGWPLADLDETLAYVAVHTGIHLGVIMTLRRLVG